MIEGYSYAIHSVQTGIWLADVEPISGSWVRGAVEEKDFVFSMASDGLTRAQRRDLFKPWERAIVVRWNGVPVYAGLICGRPRRPAARMLTIKHIDVRALLARRMLFGVSHYSPTGVFDFTGYSLRGVIRQFLYYGLLHPYSAAWPVNAEIGGGELGSSPWARFFHYDFQNVEPLLADAETQEGGPDVDMAVEYRNGNTLWWVARIGTPFLSAQNFETRLLGDSTLVDVDILDDSMRQATGIFTQGRGSEEDMRVGQASLPTATGVSRDYVVPFKDVDDVGRLNSLAAGQLGSVANPRVEWRFSGTVADFPPSSVGVGSIIRVWIEDDDWDEDGWKFNRVLSFSGSVGSNKLAFEVEAA